MDQPSCCCLLVTANVGTLFEQYEELSESWCNTIAKAVAASNAGFFALHLQETGGKHVAEGLKLVPSFLSLLAKQPELLAFKRTLAIIDDQPSSPSFTALGNIYMVKEDITAEVWDATSSAFVLLQGRQTILASSPSSSDTELFKRAKFARDIYPIPWTRKGYCQTRWRLNQHDVSFVNVHLFHDASNTVALSQTPSVYAQCRAAALKIVRSNTSWSGDNIAYFGDFNTRLALGPTVEAIQQLLKADKRLTLQEDELAGLCLTCDDQEVLHVTPKRFAMPRKEELFLATDNGRAMLAYDRDLLLADVDLHEQPITFAPSYPYSETAGQPHTFLNKRCPGWCDRVLTTSCLQPSVVQASYQLIGQDVCMGDHKPVQLTIELI